MEGPPAVVAQIQHKRRFAINAEYSLLAVFNNLGGLAFQGLESCHDYVRPLIAKPGNHGYRGARPCPQTCGIRRKSRRRRSPKAAVFRVKILGLCSLRYRFPDVD